ncbi:MAG: right-handed parallel beta-helix repeat-containing protein, partial [Candidatus Zixiibacteriota bacterium]
MAWYLKSATEVTARGPKKTISTERPWQIFAPKADGSYGVDTYQQHVGDVMIVDPYPFACYTNYTSTDVADSTSAIFQLNKMCDSQLTPIVKRTKATNPTMSWWYDAQVFSAWERDKDTINHPTLWHRLGGLPTPNGMRAQLNLALCYGTRGLGYYQIPGGVQLSADVENVKTVRSSTPMAASFEEQYVMPGCDTNVSPGAVPLKAGLMKQLSSTGEIVPYDQGVWDAAKAINQFAQRNADFFLNATWRDAGRHSTVKTLVGSFIDSIKSISALPAQVEVSFWQYGSYDYSFVVSKRTATGDSSKLNMYFPAGYNEIVLVDSILTKVDTLWDSAGTTRYSLTLQPGEGRLIRYKQIHSQYWKGALEQNWTWPLFAKITVTGDLTVPAGVDLTINSKYVSILANTDSIGFGDISRIDIFAFGNLTIQGTSTNRIVLDPGSGANPSWYGIRSDMENSGRIVIDNAIIRHAYAGVYIQNDATGNIIRNSRFEDCAMYGCGPNMSSSLLVENDTFVNFPAGYGVRMSAVSNTDTIRGCYFHNVKYPVYLTVASPVIEDSKFYTTQFIGAAGQPSVQLVSRCGSVKVTNCEFNNVPYGIKIANASGAIVNLCQFTSDSIRSSDKAAFMVSGVVTNASSLSGSACTIRNSCFRFTESQFVTRANNTSVDLGQVSDTGRNWFRLDSVIFDQNGHYKWFPGNKTAVGAYGSPTLPAELNYWIGHMNFVNSVDTTPSLYPGGSLGYCWPEGGSEKLVANAHPSVELPYSFEVSQNYPNPFNPTTEIRFVLPESKHTLIEVFNVLGQRVSTIIDRQLTAGEHVVSWNGRTDDDGSVASGVYLYRLTAGSYSATRKMILVK